MGQRDAAPRDTEQQERGADHPQQGGKEPYLPVLVDYGVLRVVG